MLPLLFDVAAEELLPLPLTAADKAELTGSIVNPLPLLTYLLKV